MNIRSIDEVLAAYVRAAAAHGKATERGDHKAANSSANEIATAHRQLRQFELQGQNALKELLCHTDRGVRLWAASHALEFAPKDAERVLADLASLKGSLVGFSAEMTLRQWRAGQLTFP